MPVDTFWSGMRFDGGSAIGAAGVDTRPYARLSEGTSSMAQKVLDDAAALFPEFDGVSNVALPLPADYASPSYEGFLNWHSAHQLAFLKETLPNYAVGDRRAVTFGASANPYENQTFLLSADGRRVIHVNRLQTGDIARLSLADQTVLADLPAFRALHANPLGLWPADDVYGVAAAGGTPPPATADAARQQLLAGVTALEGVVQASTHYVATQSSDAIDASNATQFFGNLIMDQLGYLRQRIGTMAIFNPDAVNRMISDLKDRFDRMETYAKVTRPVTDTFEGMTFRANSTDGLRSLDSALQVFAATEVQQRNLAKEVTGIAATGKYNKRDVDTPLMVFLFQRDENYSAEADAQARSEELSQMNALIQAYTRIQKVVNDTLQKFDPIQFQKDHENDDKAVERKALNGGTHLAALNLTADEKLLISMFDTTYLEAANNTYHPLEVSTNALRPTFDMIGPLGLDAGMRLTATLVAHTQKEWDLFSQNLAKTAKLLSQDSQARMDEVNKISRAKNRNYELATDTIGKMAEILRSIIN